MNCRAVASAVVHEMSKPVELKVRSPSAFVVLACVDIPIALEVSVRTAVFEVVTLSCDWNHVPPSVVPSEANIESLAVVVSTVAEAARFHEMPLKPTGVNPGDVVLLVPTLVFDVSLPT